MRRPLVVALVAAAPRLVLSQSFGTRLEALTHDGELCNSTEGNSSSDHNTFEHEHDPLPASSFAAGIALSMFSDVIIAAGLGLQKLAHNRNVGPDGKPIKPYGLIPLYWIARCLNFGGEAGNVLAYGLAPASVVAPAGCIGVLANEVIAVAFLGEPLRRRDLIGLLLVTAGIAVVIFVGRSGATNEVLDVHELLSTHVILAQRTYWYLIAILLFVGFIVIWIEPRYAHENILIWMCLCALISSISVVATRGWASLVTQITADCSRAECVHGIVHPPCAQTIYHWLFWLLLALILLSAFWSVLYLNRAMQVYGNTEVVPVYYATFSLASVVAGAIVFQEFERVSWLQLVVFACGIGSAVGGVALLMSGRSSHHHHVLPTAPTSSSISPADNEPDTAHEAATEGAPSSPADVTPRFIHLDSEVPHMPHTHTHTHTQTAHTHAARIRLCVHAMSTVERVLLIPLTLVCVHVHAGQGRGARERVGGVEATRWGGAQLAAGQHRHRDCHRPRAGRALLPRGQLHPKPHGGESDWRLSAAASPEATCPLGAHLPVPTPTPGAARGRSRPHRPEGGRVLVGARGDDGEHYGGGGGRGSSRRH